MKILAAALAATSVMGALNTANAASSITRAELKALAHKAQEAKKDGPVSYKSAWKAEVPANTKMIGVGDITGDGATRLLTLDDKGVVTVNKFAADVATSEGKVELGAGAKSFVIGAFAKGKPDIIAAPGTVAFKVGTDYKTQKAAEVSDITGTAKFTDGDSVFFLFDGAQPISWAIKLGDTATITEGRQLAPPDQAAGVYRLLAARLSPEILAGIGVPANISQFGIVMVVDARANDKPNAIVPFAEGEGHYVVTLPAESFRDASVKPLWKSQKLSGKIIDLTYGIDPKGSKKQGVFVLLSSGDGKPKTVEFLALE